MLASVIYCLASGVTESDDIIPRVCFFSCLFLSRWSAMRASYSTLYAVAGRELNTKCVSARAVLRRARTLRARPEGAPVTAARGARALAFVRSMAASEKGVLPASARFWPVRDGDRRRMRRYRATQDERSHSTRSGHLIRATIRSSSPEEHGGFAFVGRPVGCRKSRFHFTVARWLDSRLLALQLFSCRRNANRGAQVRRWT